MLQIISKVKISKISKLRLEKKIPKIPQPNTNTHQSNHSTKRPTTTAPAAIPAFAQGFSTDFHLAWRFFTFVHKFPKKELELDELVDELDEEPVLEELEELDEEDEESESESLHSSLH